MTNIEEIKQSFESCKEPKKVKISDIEIGGNFHILYRLEIDEGVLVLDMDTFRKVSDTVSVKVDTGETMNITGNEMVLDDKGKEEKINLMMLYRLVSQIETIEKLENKITKIEQTLVKERNNLDIYMGEYDVRKQEIPELFV